MTSEVLSRERITELLAAATEDELVALADECLSDGAEFTVLTAPEVGSIAARVREPICHDHFFLGDVLACRAEVTLAGVRGWAMRLGDEKAATLAAAICDAEVQGGRGAEPSIRELCERVAQRLAASERAEWAQLEPTVVRFEEL
ncbi:phosphonate metabolism protein PhnG [Rhodococcus rhodnii]|uniref:Phosphonate metabolism protein PhnG n=2 Tax=Rhodococcus rhodnii TaxID=38312 RepID=R7WNG8_9NOCA|nr:phosphonate C-P lyase system protein PhnG [Rhodococcus rhodnii]EOM76843.1 hypothetical protein Rrhod_1756 [Rhodococcus rhodnii LMG 5362]TXG89786.1 phosphonate metabolism protein PhnG [Rhodococcus rhodnii]